MYSHIYYAYKYVVDYSHTSPLDRDKVNVIHSERLGFTVQEFLAQYSDLAREIHEIIELIDSYTQLTNSANIGCNNVVSRYDLVDRILFQLEAVIQKISPRGIGIEFSSTDHMTEQEKKDRFYFYYVTFAQ